MDTNTQAPQPTSPDGLSGEAVKETRHEARAEVEKAGEISARGTALTDGVAPENKHQWFSDLREDLRNHPGITKHASIESLAQSNLEKDKLIGKKIQELSADEVKKFLSPEELYELARPKNFPSKVDEYKLPTLDKILPEELSRTIAKKGFERGIDPSVMEDLINFQKDVQSTLKVQERKGWQDEVFNRYGVDTEKNVAIATRALKELDTPEMITLLNQSGLGDHPLVIEHYRKLGVMMLEDRIPHNNGASLGGDAVSEVKSEIRRLKSNKEFYTQWYRKDKAAMAKMDALYERLSELESNSRR